MGSNRSTARLVRFGIFALVLIACGYILSSGSSYTNTPVPQAVEKSENKPEKADQVVPAAAIPKENAPAAAPDAAAPDAAPNAVPEIKNAPDAKVAAPVGDRVKATFVSLARNSDLNSLLGSIRQVEDRFNKNFHYDWVFLNDEPFTDEFKRVTSSVVSGTTKYGLIPQEQWSFPEWIDKEKAALAREKMKQEKVIYGDSIPYRHMCRYESGFFWRHELMEEYEYYWRVEPDIKIYCDIDYDIFRWMKDNNKLYSFTITLPEYKATIPTLWDVTKKFIQENPSYIHENNLLDWISDDKGETYNGCHFWSNFEVASLEVWRSEAYRKYFDTLDQAGGFFYERWGDAPVHSIAAALFLPRESIHFFGDVGYYHVPFHNCPIDEETRIAKKCVCEPKEDFSWKLYSCTGKFHTIQNLARPKGWENFAN